MIDKNIFTEKKAAFYTLGCKLNFAETSTIGKHLTDIGIRKVRKGEQADIIVVNTCTVTELAEKKCRQAIRKLIKQNPDAYCVVTGCYAQLRAEDISQIEGVDLILGAEQKQNVLPLAEDFVKKGKAKIITSKSNDIRTFSPSCSSDDRTRHFLKVQDGCDYFCTYCTIPQARGRSRNGSIESLVKQAEEVIAKGGKEIVLTGVNIGDFGQTTGETFLELVKALDGVKGEVRYRISSIEPNLLTDEIIDFVATSRHFAPHFHIPLQSGCDDVLRLMHRRYDTALFRHKIERIKAEMPDAFIGVDVIVGTQGETKAYFEEAQAFIKSLDISQLHVFSYSKRPDTMALHIDHTVPPEEKHARSQALLNLSEQKLRAFYEARIGKSYSVLFEHTPKGEMMHGYTENYIKVEAPYDINKVNRMNPVTLGDWNTDQTTLTITL